MSKRSKNNESNKSKFLIIVAMFCVFGLGFAIAQTPGLFGVTDLEPHKIGDEIFEELEGNIENLEEKLEERTPQDEVVALAADECPDGWKEYEEAEGKFLRGSAQTRGVNESQDYAMPQITGYFGRFDTAAPHKIGGAFYKDSDSGSYEIKWRQSENTQNTVHFDSAREVGGEHTDTEVRPDNVAVLYCIRE